MNACGQNTTRRTSYKTGLAAEAMAKTLLKNKQYRILAERYRNKAGEIDLVASRNGHLAFIEVKGRKTLEEAAWAVAPRQQMRIAAAAEIFLGDQPQLADYSASFDVILVTPDQGCEHIEQAFLA